MAEASAWALVCCQIKCQTSRAACNRRYWEHSQGQHWVPVPGLIYREGLGGPQVAQLLQLLQLLQVHQWLPENRRRRHQVITRSRIFRLVNRRFQTGARLTYSPSAPKVELRAAWLLQQFRLKSSGLCHRSQKSTRPGSGAAWTAWVLRLHRGGRRPCYQNPAGPAGSGNPSSGGKLISHEKQTSCCTMFLPRTSDFYPGGSYNGR